MIPADASMPEDANPLRNDDEGSAGEDPAAGQAAGDEAAERAATGADAASDSPTLPIEAG